ncbi:DUF2383 domain-containing protein [Hugenholtzia roseola]|uniref:DUF2383 domain-containing protein n=1 Tax=Hugenholtzia roseola TaxID=1002 RepID=UPI0003F89111|nr:DUF2383 domain-containing protein [Hugenholtzia roseola]
MPTATQNFEHLIKICKDAYEGYQTAKENVLKCEQKKDLKKRDKIVEIEEKLQLFADERRVMFAELNKVYQHWQQKTIYADTLIGALHRTWIEVQAFFNAPLSHTLEACIEGERLSLVEYQKCLTLYREMLPTEAVEILIKQSAQIENCLYLLSDLKKEVEQF